jgi:hypothetical protein
MTVRELLASNEGALPASSWPGGYPLLYHAADGFVFCPACANEVLADDGYDAADKPVVGDVFYEGPSEQCEHCGKEIESAYGDPDAEAA